MARPPSILDALGGRASEFARNGGIGDLLSDYGRGLTRGKNWQQGMALGAQFGAEAEPYRAEQAEQRANAERSKANAAFLVGNPELQRMVADGSIDFQTGYGIWKDLKADAQPDMQVINGQLIDAKTGKVYG